MKTGLGAREMQKLVLAAAALLAGCGGGGGGGSAADPQPAPIAVKNVVVVGASYSDLGAWGQKVGLQNSANAAGFPLYSELTAQKFGVQGQCNFYSITSAFHIITVNERPGCTNFATSSGDVQGNRISISDQLARAAQVQGGLYTAQDLVLVEGGGPDFDRILQASLVSDSYMRQFVATLIDQPTLDALFAQPRGYELVGGLYMERLADVFYGLVKTQLLDKGATHVVLLDMPDYSRTPAVDIAMSPTGLRPDMGSRETVQAAARIWVDRFNARLRERVGNDSRIVLVPFHDDFVNVVTHPGDYGLTNVTGQVCQQVSPATCDVAKLDASPPPGQPAGWWQSWLFANSMYFTPKGQQLLADSVDRALVRAGWR